ncbi:hypothetical protein HETIRDRAFT_449278 [Heterobasidion irregulare TC 32-1]|uniref:Uncharacterized protein n=1 Tax=Heterobasidion irregulare (strain TC 32-1) TaxID=747525 RepID=W4KCR9_HETIT|nr:uncharacterized protein HETIRDRAFT_449278 [Heterobasidion irregulare TC 32-1]ETW83578.1 hypothetical protein HETIRDRAFT_449278 [Heterobasidion irregulare TC 32-1]
MSSGQVSGAIFTLFLSKRAHPQQSILMEGEQNNESVSPRSIDPYTDLGFDQFAKIINWGDTWTLEEVATDDHLATLGRPLLPLEFISNMYESLEQQQQIEGHMRVPLKIESGFRTMETICPSEPILAEGPTPDDAQKSRGARKDVLLEDILSAGPYVFKSDEEKDRPLKETFAKIHDRSLLRREYLLYLASRGIGTLYATSQAGIDAFVPFNDHRYATTINPSLLDDMDPYDLGLFNEEGDANVPIIRIVFALAGRTTFLTARSPLSPSTRKEKSEALKRSAPSAPDTSLTIGPMLTGPYQPPTSESLDQEAKESRRFTAYDIWCSGLTSEIYAPITQESESVWADSLKTSKRWKEPMYETGDETNDRLRKA